MPTLQKPVEESEQVVGTMGRGMSSILGDVFSTSLSGDIISPLIDLLAGDVLKQLNESEIKRTMPAIMHTVLKEVNNGKSEASFTEDAILQEFKVNTLGDAGVETAMLIFEKTDFAKECMIAKDTVQVDLKTKVTIYTFACERYGLHVSEIPDFVGPLAEHNKEIEEANPYTVYKHHGVDVFVKKELKGKHREHCLCYDCALFFPGTLNNCSKSDKIYDNCVDLEVVTPVWECGDFEPRVWEELSDECACGDCDCEQVSVFDDDYNSASE